MLETSCNPPLVLGNCDKFYESFSRMANVIPEGTKGNGNVRVGAPYAETRLSLPRIPYEPKPMSLARPQWEGWRYGANYMNTDGIEKPYGYPDYTYYRGNYCGPCCPCVQSIAPLGGDPQGKNPNIRYVQLDYKNLLGSGFATQGPPQSQYSPYMMGGGNGNPGATTSCGRDHCKECSGVYKKTEQPVKFQVCIGDQAKPETVQPCPVQPMKIYLPLSMIPRGGDNNADDENEDGESCNDNSNNGPLLTSMEKPQFEVHIPGQEQAYNQQGGGVQYCVGGGGDADSGNDGKCVSAMPPSLFDPCGCCKACKNPVSSGPSKFGTDARKCQITSMDRPPKLNCTKKLLPSQKM